MKKVTKLVLVLVFLVAIGVSFFAGRYTAQQEYADGRKQRRQTYLSFAISKAENDDLSDLGVMKALISNVYAAYACSENTGLSSQLHDLWNTLIFRGDGYIGNEDALVTQLNILAEGLQAGG